MKKFLVWAAILLTAVIDTKAQDISGIQFDQRLEWAEILSKAKTEHKYIFVDCYATWCGPCKMMEANVYPQKEVGEVYNKAFISIELQMDQTSMDDSLTKSKYQLAKTFEENYHVEAYPTFLFFDPDGKPVHKVSGTFDEKRFVQLAADAQNPNKQYYAILKNFQPGKLDTTDEKGLPWAFVNSDKELAGKIAADYLSRIPRSGLKLPYSRGLMERFQDNQQVVAVAKNYLNSLNKAEFIDDDNINIMRTLIRNPQVEKIVIEHLQSLLYKEMDKNLDLMEALSSNDGVKKIADAYINRLPKDSLFTGKYINFLEFFTHNTSDRGFRIFYADSNKVDKIMKGRPWYFGTWENGNANSIARGIIKDQEFKPLLIRSEKAGVIPDFDSIRQVIAKKFDAKNAQVIISNGKVDWFDYLVNHQKKEQYWPQLIRAQINVLLPFPSDSTALKVSSYAEAVNNLSWYTFLHVDDPDLLSLEAGWMKKITKANINNTSAIASGWDFGWMDTYACLLYKLGHSSDAIAEEEQVVKVAKGTGHPFLAADFQKKAEAMKHNEKIWLEKAYQ